MGSSTHFISGISYYTYFLAKALRQRNTVTVVLMRKLIPRRLYPGRSRVGSRISDLQVSELVPTYEGVDWFGFPSMVGAVRFLRRHRPEVAIFQWWTGSVVLWYLLLYRTVRRTGGKCVLELHEDLDTAELNIPLVPRLVTIGLRRLVQGSAAYVVHSDHDATRLGRMFQLPSDRIWVIPHGPYPMAVGPAPASSDEGATTVEPGNGRPVELLFFGTIRPYKGLEVLVDAFEELAGAQPGAWRLTVVGETWEGWTLPLEKIARSPYAQLITVQNSYVPDEALPALFERADLVVLPYLRASASGPLQLTMTAGLPVVVSEVGGLVEAADAYSGATFAEPGDSASLARAIRAGAAMGAQRHSDPHSWDRVAERFEACLAAVAPTPSSAAVLRRPIG